MRNNRSSSSMNYHRPSIKATKLSYNRRKNTTFLNGYFANQANEVTDDVISTNLSIKVQEKPIEKIFISLGKTLNELKIEIFKRFEIPFEEQILTWNGEDRLASDAGAKHLMFFGFDDTGTLYVSQQKQYRKIGDPVMKIEVLRLKPHSSSEYEIVKTQASLPPVEAVIRRVSFVIQFLLLLDRMQQKRTYRAVWKDHRAHGTLAAKSHFQQQQSSKGRHRRKASGQIHVPLEELVARMENSKVPAPVKRLVIPCENRSDDDLREIKHWLGNLKYFVDASIPEINLTHIARNAQFRVYRAGEQLFREGDVGEFFYIIVSGRVALAASGCGLFATFGTGKCFGEMSLFKDNLFRTASATVDYSCTNAEILVIHKSIYQRNMSAYKQASLDEVARLLRKLPCFASMSKAAMVHVMYSCSKLRVEAKDSVIDRGTPCGSLYFLVKGTVKVTAFPQNVDRYKAKVFVMDVLSAPKVFGQECCSQERNPKASFAIQAVTDVTMLCMNPTSVNLFVGPYYSVMQEILTEHYSRKDRFKERLDVSIRQDKAGEKALVLERQDTSNSLSDIIQSYNVKTKSVVPHSEFKMTNTVKKSAYTTMVSNREAFLHEKESMKSKTLPHSSLLVLEEQQQLGLTSLQDTKLLRAAMAKVPYVFVKQLPTLRSGFEEVTEDSEMRIRRLDDQYTFMEA